MNTEIWKLDVFVCPPAISSEDGNRYNIRNVMFFRVQDDVQSPESK